MHEISIAQNIVDIVERELVRHGVTELKAVNVAVGKISALAICQRLVWTLASLPGLIVHLVGAHLPKDFFVDYEETLD